MRQEPLESPAQKQRRGWPVADGEVLSKVSEELRKGDRESWVVGEEWALTLKSGTW